MSDAQPPDKPRPAPADAPSQAEVDESIDDLLVRYASGPPPDEDWVDPELEALAQRPPVLQLLLIVVVMAFGGFVAWTLRYDALYFFADDTPLEIGAVEDLAQVVSENPDYLRQLGSNRYVHVSGVPQRRAVTGDKQFAQLVGAPVFVEMEREDPGADPLLRDVRFRLGPGDRRPRYYVDTAGRLLAMTDFGRRYEGFVEFYRDGYDMWFCGTELTPRQLDFRRLTARELATELGREPTEAELDTAFPCTFAVLVQADTAPSDHLGYFIAMLFIGLVELGGLFYVVKWARQAFRVSRS